MELIIEKDNCWRKAVKMLDDKNDGGVMRFTKQDERRDHPGLELG